MLFKTFHSLILLSKIKCRTYDIWNSIQIQEQMILQISPNLYDTGILHLFTLVLASIFDLFGRMTQQKPHFSEVQNTFLFFQIKMNKFFVEWGLEKGFRRIVAKTTQKLCLTDMPVFKGVFLSISCVLSDPVWLILLLLFRDLYWTGICTNLIKE